MGGIVTRLERGSATLADRMRRVRARLFVGREAEQTAFTAFAAPDAPHALWFIVGPGGVGKSALLRQLRERAAESGLSPVFLDARVVLPNPPAVRHALARAAAADSLEAFCAEHERPVLFIDSFEYWQELEPWLREELLPSLPADLKLVFAGRLEPGLEWRTDEGWRALMRLSHLTDLDERDSADYLARRGLEPAAREELIRFAAGHPLALAMGADSVLAGKPVAELEQEGDDTAIRTLVESFTREARDADERRAMDACAVVRELNESLLAHMLGRDDATALFEWLRSLSFVDQGEAGIYPHDLVREVLMREMPRRYPGRYEAFARAAVNWTVDRIEAAPSLSWKSAALLASDGMYSLRALPVVQHFLQPIGTRALFLDRARRGDLPALAEMVARHEGETSRRLFEFWLARHPRSVFVVRDAREAPRGFFMKLDMEALEADDCEADPVVARLRAALAERFELNPGEHVPFVRFWVTADYAQSQSPEKTQILMAIHTYNMMAQNLRLTAQVFGASDDWVVQAQALGIELLPGSDIPVDDKRWRIYYNDWRRESPTRYYRNFAQRCIGFQQAVAGEAAPAQPYKMLEEAAFHEHALDALRHLHRPAAFARNPLLGSALVVYRAGRGADEQARMQVLAEQIHAAADSLGAGGERERRWQRVLHRAYLAPAASQKSAAAALNMGYSTFRRQLADARAALAEELWRREKAAR